MTTMTDCRTEDSVKDIVMFIFKLESQYYDL